MSSIDPRPFQHRLPGDYVVRTTRADDAAALERLQEIVFPDLAPAERFRAEHYRRHVELFPAGQFVVALGEEVVGMTSTLRRDVDLDHVQHTFAEVIDGGFLTSHDPGGRWLYGVDVGTHPEHRRRGVARALYAARHATVRALGLEGQVTVGMPNGYAAHRHELTPRAYYEALLDGRLGDPTISAQRHLGFEPRALIERYLHDPTCGDCGVFLVLPASRDVPFESAP